MVVGLHCTAKIPRTAGSMPSSVCLNGFKQMEVQASRMVSVNALQYTLLRLLVNISLTLTRPADSRHNTDHILDSVRGVSRECLRDGARDSVTKLL